MNQKRVRPQPSLSITHAAVLALYALLVVLLTWPLTQNIFTHVVGNGIDDPALAWNLWWMKARLVEQLNFDIFHADWMFFPVDINLSFYTLTPLNGLLSIPLQSAFTLIFASNILLFFSFILGGYGTYLLALNLLTATTLNQKKLFQIRCAAVVAGIIYAFASSKIFYASLGQFNIASSHWIPFCVLFLLRIDTSTIRIQKSSVPHLEKQRWDKIFLANYTAKTRAKNAGLAGLFLVFQAWSELTYASFLLIFIALYFIWLQLSRQSIRRRVMLLGNFIIIGIVFLIGLAPFLWAMIPDMLVEGDFFASGGGFADIFSADLYGYLVPTKLNPFLGEWVETLPFEKNLAQHIYIGYVGLGLALFGAFAHRRSGGTIFVRPSALQSNPLGYTKWFWIVNLLIFWLLTLGPILRWRGENLHLFGVPLYAPFALVSQLPFFSGNRYPSRYSVMLMLCIAILAAMGLAWLLSRLSASSINPLLTRRRNWLAAGICTVLSLLYLSEHLSAPLPINNSITPSIYETIRDTPGDFSVLELPTGWRNGAYVLGKSDELIMMQQWHQSIHGKRRLGGNTSRNPSFKFEYFINAPLIGDLIVLMNADREHIGAALATEISQMTARNQARAPRVLDFLDVGFITVDVTRSPLALQEFVETALPVTLVEEWRGEDWKGEPQQIRLYVVDGASFDPPTGEQRNGWTIRLSDEESSIYLAEGWSPLASDDIAAGDDEMRYALRPQADLLVDIADAGGRLTLTFADASRVRGMRLNGTPLTLAVDGGRVVAEVPLGLASAPVDRLAIHFAPEPVPVELPLWVVAMSAGQEHGDYARLFVNGQDVALNEVGYNVVAVAPTGELLESIVFNTHDSQDEVRPSAAMARWLGKWPDGTVIAGAVRDTAGRQLGEDAVGALKQIGIVADLRGELKLRWNHAFITTAGDFSAAGDLIGFSTINVADLPLEESSLLQPSALFLGSPIAATTSYGAIHSITFEPKSLKQ